jgi:putative ABC transport system permease protein
VLAAPGPGLIVALVVLVLIAVTASLVGQLRQEKAIAFAAGRAVVQLAAVSLIITAALSHLVWSAVFALFMFTVAVITSSRRIGAPRAWPWVAAAMASGLVPTLAVIFASGAIPFTGPSLVPVAGIIIGGTMTANSLAGRRAFAALREEKGSYEAALSLGLTRAESITEVVGRRLPEALVPGMDQTRTVGLVTLPGAFIGVLLGGGSPIEAGTAQLLVLLGLLSTQTITIVVGHRLMRAGRLLPADLAMSLQV